MGAFDKQYIQALAAGQKFKVEFKPGTEAAKLSGEYKTVEIKSGRGRGGTLNVIAVDMSGNPMPDVPIEDPKHGIVIADRCFGTSAWPMVQTFIVEGRLIYDAATENMSVEAAKTANIAARKATKPAVEARKPPVKHSTPRPTPSKLSEEIAGGSESIVQNVDTSKSTFVQQRTQLTNARVHATANQPKKVYDSLLPILENKGNKSLLLRFTAVPMTNELNGDYSVVSYAKVNDSAEPKLVINLQSLDIPNKLIAFDSSRVDIHIKRIDEISQGR